MNAFSKPARVSAIVIAILFPSLVTWVYFDLLADGPSSLQKSAYGVGKLLQFAFPLVWILFFLKQPLNRSGIAEAALQRRWSVRYSLVFGVIVGAAVVVVMFCLYRMFPKQVLDPLHQELIARIEGFSVETWPKYLGLAVFYAIVHSFMEEYYFRWFVFGQLRNVTGFVPAMIVSGLAFMAHHLIVLGQYFSLGWTLFLALAITIGGLIWAYQYEKSTSLVGPWASHAIVDAGIFAVGYHLLFVSVHA